MNVEDHAFRDATDEKDRIIVDIRARLAAALAENSDLRALLTEARSHNPEKYRSSSDDSGTHGAELGGDLLPSPSSDSTRVAPSGEGSGQPMIREGWCPHCGITRIEDYSGVARNGGRAERAEAELAQRGHHETAKESSARRGVDAEFSPIAPSPKTAAKASGWRAGTTAGHRVGADGREASKVNEADVRGASRGQAIGCFKSPFRYQSGYVFDANNRMVADMPWSAVCRVRGWGRLQYRTDCDPEALQDMVGILIAEALTRLWDEEAPKGGGA